MSWKTFFGISFALMAIFLLVGYYWFYPFHPINFSVSPSSGAASGQNYNFTREGGEKMQFYENMRYQKKEISYNISNCPLQRKYDMERALEIVSNATVLRFYPTTYAGEISVTCEERERPSEERGFFIAGEGGPVNITNTTRFNVIFRGEVLLIKDSQCPTPNVAVHELLHALGFSHSSNPKSIMYNITDCDQQIGQDITDRIKMLYSTPSQPDLSIENASALMHGKYLDANVTVKNNGLAKSGNSTLAIYADGKNVSQFSLGEMEIGIGTKIRLSNIRVLQLNTREIEFSVDYPETELEKNNNKLKLETGKS